MATFFIQPASSHVNWTGKKVLGLHTGNIQIATGQITLADNQLISGDIDMDMTTIQITDIDDPKTHDEFLAHLRNEDFFAVEAHPIAKLVVTGSTYQGDNQYEINANLTIKEITHPVRFVVTIEVFTDFLHAMGTLTIDRTLYNIRYGSGKFIPNLGDKLIYDAFVLQFKLVGQAIQ